MFGIVGLNNVIASSMKQSIKSVLEIASLPIRRGESLAMTNKVLIKHRNTNRTHKDAAAVPLV
jgi:hypothetical protein